MLKDVRKSRGLSQSAAASASGVNLRMLQYYEQGIKDINKAGLATLLKICVSLECCLSDIVTDDETLALLHQYEQQERERQQATENEDAAI